MNLKVSEKEKFANDGQWFKDIMHHHSPFGNNYVEEFDKMIALYRVVNMDISDFTEQIKQFCNPLGDLSDDVITNELVPLPELKNKINVLQGELIKRNDRFVLQLITAQAIQQKNDELYENIKQSVDELVGLHIQGLEEQLKGMPEEQAQQVIQQLRSKYEPEDLLSKDWLSELEIFFNTVLRHAYVDQGVKMKQADTIYDAVTTDRCFVFNGWKNGKPHIEVRNPLHIDFHKKPNEPFVHKSDWISYRSVTTIAQAIEDYNLSDEDVKQLSVSTGLSKQHNAIGGKDLAQPVFDRTLDPIYQSLGSNNAIEKTVGLNQTSLTTNAFRKRLVYETHFEFKAFKRVYFLTYTDEFNVPVTEILSDQFEVPANAVKEKFINRFDQETTRYVWVDTLLNKEFEAEEIWIPRKYEIIRLGYNVFPVYREVPYQEVNPEDPYSSFCLSTKGVFFNNRNALPNSLISQALPSYFQLLYIKAVQNRELAKYMGFIHSVDVDQIPDELGLDAEGQRIRDKVATYFAFLRKSNVDLFSGTQTSSGGLPPATRSPGSSGFNLGTAIELMNLQQLAELTKRELSMTMGISPQREANYAQGTNVSDNQQAVINSYTITEPLFFRHSLMWKDVLEDHIKAMRTYVENQINLFGNFSLEVWLPNNSKELLNVTPRHIQHSNVGLMMINSSSAEKYAELMMQSVHAFAQNQGQGVEKVSQILKDIVTGASPEEIHKRIQILEKESFDRQKELEELASQRQKELEQMKIDAREDEQAHELDVIRLQAELDLNKELLTAEPDTDDNGVSDFVELRKLDLKQQEVQLKREELDVKKQVLRKKNTPAK